MALDERTRWLNKGIVRVNRWCIKNDIREPIIHVEPGKPRVASCAYYREGHIWIYPSACAVLGRGGPAWSWPGYAVDRTPFGVLCHELGHHVDHTDYTGRLHYGPLGAYSSVVRRKTGEAPLTSYCPDDTEWFAEMFRLFATNPDLLAKIRPRTFTWLDTRYDHVELRSWRKVLQTYGAAPRHIAAAQNKIRQAR